MATYEHKDAWIKRLVSKQFVSVDTKPHKEMFLDLRRLLRIIRYFIEIQEFLLFHRWKGVGVWGRRVKASNG